jgi:hypothetical protein
MYYALESSDTDADADIDSLMRFVYDHLYGDAYGDEAELGFAGYRQYVAGLRSEHLKQIHGRARLGKATVAREVKMLLIRAELQGLGIDL